MIIINASLGYHNLKNKKVDKKSLYLTTFGYQFDRYRFTIPPFEVTQAVDKFLQKISKTFKDLSNIFGTADILTVDYDLDGRDLDKTLKLVMQIF